MRQIQLLFSLNCYPVWEDWLQTRKQLNTDTIPKCENATKRCRACQSSRQRKLESVTQKEACVVCWVSNQKARALPWMTSLSRWWLERVRACSKPESLTQDIWGGTPEFASNRFPGGVAAVSPRSPFWTPSVLLTSIFIMRTTKEISYTKFTYYKWKRW